MKIIEQLRNVQSKLKAPKGQFNSFGKYRYRSCEDILEAVKPLLAEEGLILILTDEVVWIGDRFYVRATATVKNEDGESESNAAYAREESEKKGMDGSQITGTSSSYARKYALNGLFLIDDTKDADTDEHAKQTKKSEQAKAEKDADLIPHGEPVTVERLEKLLAEIERTGSVESKICTAYKIKDLRDLTEAQYISAMNRLEKMPDKEAAK